MSSTIQDTAVVLHGPKDLRIESRVRQAPGRGEAQVAIQATGLCGSDLHYYVHGRNGDFAVREPLVLGHEAAGIITALGPDIDPSLNLKVGDRVAIECGKACGHSHPSSSSPRASSSTSSASPRPSPRPFARPLLTIPTGSSGSTGSSAHSDTDDEGTAVDDEDSHSHPADEIPEEDEDADEDEEGDGCEYCSSGRYNLCQGMRFCSSAKTFPHLDGSLQTTMNHSAHLLHRLPDTCSYEQAALAEPLSVVLHAARRVNLVAQSLSPIPYANSALLTEKASLVVPGAGATAASGARAAFAAANPSVEPKPRALRVLVIGAGAVGFLAAALVRTLAVLGESIAPISHIAALDIDSAKLDALKNAGYADGTYTVPLPPRVKGAAPPTKEEGLLRSREVAKEALEVLARQMGDKRSKGGYDVVFECTGVESCIQMGILMARTGGKVALVGMGTPNPTIPLGAAALREVDLIGVFRYASTWPDALRLLASDVMQNVEKVMVTQKYALEDTASAFEVIAKGGVVNAQTGIKEMVLKVMVGPHYTTPSSAPAPVLA